MDIAGAFLAHRGLPRELIAARSLVVVANKQAQVSGKVQDPLHGAIELARAPAGKIGARGAVIRHEQRISDEYRITDDKGHAGRRVTRGMEDAHFQLADLELLAVHEK